MFQIDLLAEAISNGRIAMVDKLSVASKFNAPSGSATASNPIVVLRYAVPAIWSSTLLTGAVIGPGQKAWVHAERGETWLTHPHGNEGWCSVAGNGTPASDSHPLPGRSEGCMWLRVGNGTTYYFPPGGENMIAELRDQGQLVVGPNDDDLDGNAGDITLVVEIRSA